MPLTVRIKQKDSGTVTIAPIGSLDSQTYRLLDAEINGIVTDSIETLVLDMAGVDFITSAGVGTITKATTRLNQRGADLAMINLQPQVEKVFEIMDLLPRLNVFENTEELDEYLGKVQRRIIGEEEF
ncbi:MAG: STAS domain-containing protein [Planctomycetota bacterium]|jgi:anti-anti-sigma factor